MVALEKRKHNVALVPFYGSNHNYKNYPIVMVGARGFEPPTPCSQSRCATGLRHAPKKARSTFYIINSRLTRSPSSDLLLIAISDFAFFIENSLNQSHNILNNKILFCFYIGPGCS